MPDETLRSFNVGLANSLIKKRGIAKLEDEEVLKAMEVQAKKLSIDNDKLHEVTSTFKIYQVIQNSPFQNSRLNTDSYEYSEIQSEFLNEFDLSFSSSHSLEEYSVSIENLLDDFNNKDLQENDVTFITNFLVTMELYFIIAEEVVPINGLFNGRTNCNWWCYTNSYLLDMGNCAGQVFRQIGYDPALSAATVVATAATGGTAAFYGLTGIAIGCAIYASYR